MFASQQEGSGFNPSTWLQPFCVHLLPAGACMGFLPQSKDILVLHKGASVNGCLS